MTTILERFTDHTRRIFVRHRGRQFLEGAMAASALVALADGDASLEEGAEVGRLMRVLDILRDQNPGEGVETYLRYIDKLRKDPSAVDEVRAKVKVSAAGDQEAAALLIVICHAVSEADGVVRDSEVEEIDRLGRLLDIKSKDAVAMIAPKQPNV